MTESGLNSSQLCEIRDPFDLLTLSEGTGYFRFEGLRKDSCSKDAPGNNGRKQCSREPEPMRPTNPFPPEQIEAAGRQSQNREACSKREPIMRHHIQAWQS